MMNRSERGAAKVSVVWMIGSLVAFLVVAVMFFLVSQEVTNVTLRADNAEAKAVDYEKRLTEQLTQVQSMSKVIGYYDESQGQSRTEMTALTEGLNTLRATFPDIDPSITTYQKAMPVIIQAYAAQKGKVADVTTQIAGLQTKNDELTKNMRDLNEAGAKELASLRSQLADTEQAKTDMQSDLERQLAEARDGLKDRDVKWRTAQTTIEDSKRQYEREKESLRTRLDEQGRKLNPFVKEPEAADGHVLGVSQDLGLGWISLGSKNRLAVGTRFRVVAGGSSGTKTVKSWAEVTRVEPDMAEVAFLDQRDPFDPPVVGDVVFNPLFDPTGERDAVLVGRFSGGVNEAELKALLKNMGVTVRKSLDDSIDFLIVGAEMYVDENGQPLETPVAPSDLPVYKDALASGVQIVQLKDLRQYFRF